MESKIARIDLHIHSQFSDGRCSVEDVATVARMKRLSVFAITDHFSEFEALPHRMSKGHLKVYLTALNQVGAIKGVEADILSDGVSISKRSARLCDVVLGGLHRLNDRLFWGDSRPIWNPTSFVETVRVTLIKAMETNLLDVLVHPTWLPAPLRPHTKQLITKDWVQSVITAASNHKVAIEISGVWKVPDERFVQECLRQGVKLSLGSDAHNASTIGDVKYAVNLLKQVNAPLDSIFLSRWKQSPR